LGWKGNSLTDGDGNIVYTWDSARLPGNAVYLLENGNLLRTGNTGPGSLDGGSAGGIVEEIAPDGNTLICDGLDDHFFEVTPADDLTWDYDYGNQLVFRVTRYLSDYSGLLPISQ
jgi:hypothetical protein